MRHFSQLDEDQCIRHAQRGDMAAFSELVARFQERIYRFLLRLTGSQDDALDLTQETFLRAYQSLPAWRPDAHFAAWLFRIARNLAFDLLRRHKCIEFVALEDDAEYQDDTPGPEAALETAQRLRQLETALRRLPLEQREILLLRELEELSYEDIATVLDLNPGTVKSRIARARGALLNASRHATEKTA